MFWIIVIVGFIIAIPFIMKSWGYSAPTGDFNIGLDAYNAGNFKIARMEFTYLAEQGNAEAQFFLGVMYSNGFGVPQDHGKALQWYRRAAERGHESAQAKLT